MTASSHGMTFHTHCLSNGLQIVAQPMSDFESVAIAFYVRTGARDELDPAIAGVSHFLEHMTFKGTRTLDWQQITQEFNKIGAELNAFTSLEATVYYARVLGDKLSRALELLSEMMYPRLAESDFLTEKEVIINEIARSEDQPYGITYRRMLHTYFGDHPLGNYVLGTRESIHNMQVEQMRAYWQQRYSANNLILTVAGKFDWEHLLSLAEHYCGHWHSGETGRICTPYEPAQSQQNIMVDPHLKQQIMFFTMPSVSLDDPDYYAAVLGANILGDREGSRLYWHIRQQGLAESVGSHIRGMEGAGVLLLEANTLPEHASRVRQMLLDELELLLNDGVEEDELRRAKNKRIRDHVLSSESTYNRMRVLASDWVIENRLLTLDEKIARIERVTSADITRTFQRFPLREKQVLTALGPLSAEALLD
ncbi:MAG TPA: pitrilysin family protein [Ktedonobacteraceae bacterium]|jgi:predicted Zn-dependent peptidase|nr:pitrilysin family protein [Ktedonobacteraceae bacterium]